MRDETKSILWAMFFLLMSFIFQYKLNDGFFAILLAVTAGIVSMNFKRLPKEKEK